MTTLEKIMALEELAGLVAPVPKNRRRDWLIQCAQVVRRLTLSMI
jgi:hypothetical protein